MIRMTILDSTLLLLLEKRYSTGADQIPTTFVKLVADNLAGPLTRIINGCITEAYFPKLFKIASVAYTQGRQPNDQWRTKTNLDITGVV